MASTRLKIGRVLEKWRLKRGKSAGEAAREVGITVPAFRAIEQGATCKASTLEAMARAAGITRARTDKLLAQAGQIRPEMLASLVACPEHWDAMLDFITEKKSLASTSKALPPRPVDGVFAPGQTERQN